MWDKMTYQLYHCAIAIYFWQSGQASRISFLFILLTTYAILIFFSKFSISCICVPWKRGEFGSLTPKRTTLLLLSDVSMKTKSTKAIWLRQRSVLSTLSICNYRASTSFGLTTGVVRCQPCQLSSVYDV